MYLSEAVNQTHIAISKLISLFNDDFYDQKLLETKCFEFINSFVIFQLPHCYQRLQVSIGLQKIKFIDNFKNSSNIVMSVYQIIHLLVYQKLTSAEQLFQLTNVQMNNKYQLTLLYLMQQQIDDAKKIPEGYKQLVQRISFNVQNNYINYELSNYIDARLVYQVLQINYLINQNETPIQYNKLFNFLLQAQSQYDATHDFPMEVLSLYVTTKALTIHQYKNIGELIQLLKHVAENKLIFDENQAALMQHINIIILIHSILEVDTIKLDNDQIKDICKVISKIILFQPSYNSIYVKVISTLYSSMQLLLLIIMQNNITLFCQIFISLLQSTVKVGSEIIQDEKQNDYLQKCCLNYLNYYVKFTVWCQQKQIPIKELQFPEYGIQFNSFLNNQIGKKYEDIEQHTINIQDYLLDNNQSQDIDNVISLENSSFSQNTEHTENLTELITEKEEQLSSIDHLGNLIQNVLQNSSSDWNPKTRQEIIQKTEVIVYLQNLIPLNGHLIKHYSNTEFPSLLLELYMQMFNVEPIVDDQMIYIIKNPNTTALADTIYLFLNYESAMKQLILTDKQFFVVIQQLIKWTYTYLQQDQYDMNDLTVVISQLEHFIEKFYCAWEQLNGKFVEVLIQHEIILELFKLLDFYIIIDKYVAFSRLITKFLIISVEYNLKYNEERYLQKITLRQDSQWEIFKKFVSEEQFYQRIRVILEYYSNNPDKNDNMRYVCYQLLNSLTQLSYYKNNSIVLEKLLKDKEFYLQFIQSCYKYVFQQNNIAKYTLTHDEILYQFVSMCSAIEINTEGYQIYLEEIYNFDFIYGFLQQISYLQFSKLHDRLLELLTLVYYRFCDKITPDQDPTTKLNNTINNTIIDRNQRNLHITNIFNDYNSLINIVIFQIWSIFKYNLSLYTILFQMPYVFEILQNCIYGNFLINILIVDGYIGCQIRQVKQNNLDELTQQIVQINNIIESYDSFTDQQVVSNSRIDYDFVKLSYLLCLQELHLHKEIFEHLIFQPHYKLLTLAKQQQLTQYLQSSTAMTGQQYVAQKVKYILQQSLISRVNIYFILCLYKYFKNYGLRLEQFGELNLKNINDLITISNFWDFNDTLTGKFIMQEKDNVINKYQVLYPNKLLDGIQKTIKNYLSDVVLSYNIYHEIQHQYMYQLQYINMYYAIFKSLGENDVIKLVQTYDYYEIPINFSKYITASGYMIEQLQLLLQQDITDQQETKLNKCIAIIKEQQLNCYMYIHQIISKIISSQSHFYMYDQASRQMDMSKYIKKSLMFLELSVLNNQYTSQTLYETVLKLTDQKFDQINYAYDNRAYTRKQRINFNISSINNSQYDNIVYQFNYKDNILLLNNLVSKLFNLKTIDETMLKLEELSKYISIIPMFKVTIGVQKQVIQYLKQDNFNDSFKNIQLSENISENILNEDQINYNEVDKQKILDNHQNLLARLYQQSITKLEEINYNAYRNDTSIESEELTQLTIQLMSYIDDVDFVLLSFKYVILLNSFRTECDATLLLNNNYKILEKNLNILIARQDTETFVIIITGLVKKLQRNHSLNQRYVDKQNIDTNKFGQENNNITSKLIENDPFYNNLENTFSGLYEKETSYNQHVQQQKFDRREQIDNIIPYFITKFIKDVLFYINQSFNLYTESQQLIISDLIVEIVKLYAIIFNIIEDEVLTQILLNMIKISAVLTQKAFQVILNVYQSIQINIQLQQEDIKIQDYNISRNIINQYNLLYLTYYSVSVDEGKLLDFMLYQEQELIRYHQDIRSQNIEIGNFIAEYNNLSIQGRITFIQQSINGQIAQFFSKLKVNGHDKNIFKQKLQNMNKSIKYQFRSKKIYRMFKQIIEVELKNDE